MGWLAGYRFRKPIPIAAQAGAGTDYQVPLTVYSGVSPPITEEQTTEDSFYLISSISKSRVGQKLTINDRTVTTLSFKIYKAFTPSGNVTFTIRQLDDTILASKVLGDASILQESETWETVTLDTPIYVNEEVRICCEYSGALGVYVGFKNSDVKASEGLTYYDGSWTDENGNGNDFDTAYKYTYLGGDSDGVVYLNNYCTDFPNDIKFTDDDGVTELDPFNKDDHNPAADPTHWGIEVKADLDDNQNIYIYWGKSGASSPSDIVAASVFGDHFLGDTLDADKWDLSGAVSLANSEISLDNDDRILGKTAFGYGYAVEARSKADEQDSLFVSWEETLANFDNRLDIANSDASYPNDFDRIQIVSYIGGGGSVVYQDNWEDFRDTYYIYRIKRISGEVIFEQASHSYSHTTNLPTVDLKPCLRVWDSSQESTLIVDWIFVRKYVYPEPVVGTPGSLEVNPVIIRHHYRMLGAR